MTGNGVKIESAGHGDKLPRLARMAALALVMESNFRQAARRIGVDPKTLARWQKRKDFQRLVEETREQIAEIKTHRALLASEAESQARLAAILRSLPDVREQRRGIFIATCPRCAQKLKVWQAETGEVLMICRSRCPQLLLEEVLKERMSE